MKITDVPFAVLRLQYQLARVPLQLFEDRVVGRLGEEAPARLFYERSVGKLDIAVGSVLGAPDVQRRGAALIERSDALSRAARLDEAAHRAVKEAETDLVDAQAAAAAVRQEARADKLEEATQARAAAAHEKVAAINEAEERVETVKEKADQAAAERRAAVEAAKREKQEKIRAAEQSAAAVAEAKVEDAQAKRSAAATELAQADRVEQLADEKPAKKNADMQ
ncbi:hypothetical protein A5662_04720 [Mycobacteriaceae bacterium 1482268.1]|nr:hypothetical protein A5662_04720 [Mycobacteriaceae bacterium 1482268.1]